MKKQLFARLAAIGAAASATAASAVPIDFSSMTADVDFSTAQVAMLAVGGILAVLFVCRRGIGMLLGSIKGR